jgi:Bacterial pre-peptidase C-terminal domain
LCEVRALGRYGVSNPMIFVVGDLQELIESPANHSIESAQPVPLDSTVNGLADPEAVDYFRFPAARGTRLFLRAAAHLIDSPMDATLVLYDGRGREVARDRDTRGRDPFVDFTAPADGDYTVGIFDFTYAGGAGHWYRLTITRAPQVDFVMPAAIEPGRAARCTVFGRNLPGGIEAADISLHGQPLERLEVDIEAPSHPEPTTELSPSSATAPGFSWSLAVTESRANSVRLGLASAPPVIEVEPNNSAPAAQHVAIPCEVNGRFDVDWFAFVPAAGMPGRPLRVEVFSERLGHPTDPVFAIYKVTHTSEGAERMDRVVEADDRPEVAGVPRMQTGTRDPVARLVPEAGATYRILVQDRFSTRDPALVYRLAIHEERPEFQLLTAPEDPAPSEKGWGRWSVLLRKGGTGLLRVAAIRQDGFNVPIALSAEGLPEGVTASGGFIPADQNTGWVVLYARPNAASWTGRVRIVGRAGTLEREAHAVTWRWNVPDLVAGRLDARLSTGLVVAVTDAEPAPFALSPVEDKTFTTSLAGSLEIPIRLVSNTPFKGGLQLTPFGMPGLAKPKTSELKVDANGQGTLSLDFAKRDGNSFAPGRYSVYASARGTILYKSDEKAAARELRDVQFSSPVEVQLDSAPLRLSTALSGGMCMAPAARAELPVKVARLYGFSDPVSLTLIPPPEASGFSSSKMEIAKDASTGTIVLETTAEAKPGTYTFTLEASCRWRSEDLSSTTEVSVTVAP